MIEGLLFGFMVGWLGSFAVVFWAIYISDNKGHGDE